MKVSSQLEENETYQFLAMEQSLNARYGPIMPPIGLHPDMTNHQQISILFNSREDGKVDVTAQVFIDKPDSSVSRNDYPMNDPGAFDPISRLSDVERERYFQGLRNREAMARNMKYQMMMSSQSIEKRIDQKLLTALLEEEFKSNGIQLDYEYAVKSYMQGEEKLIFSSPNYKKTRLKEHQTPLYTNDIVSQKPNYLKVYFPRSRRHYLTSTSLMMIPSLILVLLIVGIFAYTIVIILRQKKLSIIKNDFINNMTHELKTPISTISLASQMLRDKSINNTPSAIDRLSGIVYDESKRLSSQVEKVLQMAIFNEGRLKMKPKKIDINELAVNVVKNFEIRVQTRNGHITIDTRATQSNIFADQMHITNVLFNLLDNADKYSRSEPEIEVVTENQKDRVLVSVKDNGIGIAKEHQKQIFERFFRVPTGNIHDVKGFGLGLHYVFKIVEAHNGEIKVDSALNKGTKFTISFPIKE